MKMHAKVSSSSIIIMAGVDKCVHSHIDAEKKFYLF